MVAGTHVEAHHLAEPDLVDKGLAHNSVGMVGSVVIALSSVAAAYALTATLGQSVGGRAGERSSAARS